MLGLVCGNNHNTFFTANKSKYDNVCTPHWSIGIWNMVNTHKSLPYFYTWNHGFIQKHVFIFKKKLYFLDFYYAIQLEIDL